MDPSERQLQVTAPDPKFTGSVCRDILEVFRPYLLYIANSDLDSQLKSKVAASDLVQESLLEAHQGFHGFRGRSYTELKSWLRTILHHNMANETRTFQQTQKRMLNREVSLEHGDGSSPHISLVDKRPSADSQASQNEEIQHLQQSLKLLPTDLRQLIVWHNLDSETFSEIAMRLNQSEKSVQKKWTRAIRELRIQMSRPQPH